MKTLSLITLPPQISFSEAHPNTLLLASYEAVSISVISG
jgi:hypothetical protein